MPFLVHKQKVCRFYEKMAEFCTWNRYFNAFFDVYVHDWKNHVFVVYCTWPFRANFQVHVYLYVILKSESGTSISTVCSLSKLS